MIQRLSIRIGVSESWASFRMLLQCVALLWAGTCLKEVNAQSPAKEYQLKAVLLWRLAQYTEFPPEALGATNSHIVLAVIGENPFGDALRLAVADETAHGRKIDVRQTRANEIPAEAHIVFVAQSEKSRVKSITTALRGRTVLTVSDIETFAQQEGGMVRFAMDQSRVSLQVNLEALDAAKLKLDSRVLRMADIVKDRKR